MFAVSIENVMKQGGNLYILQNLYIKKENCPLDFIKRSGTKTTKMLINQAV